MKEERKVRGTRMELIEPSKPSTVYITFGKESGIFMEIRPRTFSDRFCELGPDAMPVHRTMRRNACPR